MPESPFVRYPLMIRRARLRRHVGLIVVVGTLAAAVVVQFTSGIVHLSAKETYRGPVTTTPISQSQMVESQVVEYDVDASINWPAALPLGAAFLAGLLLAVVPSRKDPTRHGAT